MVPLFPIAFPKSLRATAKACLPAAIAASLFAGCISDGPNQTGTQFLEKHDILLTTPVYHVKLKAFPADSFWTTDQYPDPEHISDTIILAGSKGKFSAEPRFAWNISDTAMLDSLADGYVAADSDKALRLSLTSPALSAGPDTLLLQNLVNGAEGKAADSAEFDAWSWVFDDSGIASAAWSDSINTWNRRYLYNGEDVSILPPPTAKDHIVLKVKEAYHNHGLQARGLAGLRKALLKKSASRHIVHLRLIQVNAPGAESLSTMLRFGGEWGTQAYVANGALLLFGKTADATTGNGKNRLPTLDLGNDHRAVAYTLKYSGARTDLLNSRQRGLHVTFDRGRMLDSIDAGLRAQGITPQPRVSGKFSLAYFVPFASLSLPIDTASLETGLPLPVNMLTMTDSLLGDSLSGGIRDFSLREGDHPSDIWTLTEIGQPDVIRNHVGLTLNQINSSLIRVILTYSKDTVLNDTVYLANGESKQLTFSGQSSKRVMYVTMTAKFPDVRFQSYLVVRSGFENNELKDPATGKSIDELAKKVPRFFHASDTAITLRATGGIQSLLNRSDLGTAALQGFQFLPAANAINPKGINAYGDTVGRELPFPVLDVLTPKIESGRLKVDLDLYLYPLKAR